MHKTSFTLLILIVSMTISFSRFQLLNAQEGVADGKILATAQSLAINSINGVAIQSLAGMHLYEVVGGQIRKTYFSRQDIENGLPLISRGYVTGIVLLSESPDMTARLDTKRLIRRSEGKRFPGELVDQGLDTKRDMIAGRYHYGLFPQILGDAVSPKDQFCISIHDERLGWQDIVIQQHGYRQIPCTDEPPSQTDRATRFRFMGADLDALSVNVDDLSERIEAIASGIERVEKAFGIDLVNYVNLLSLTGVDNALTLPGQSQLWLYTDTFRLQPVHELYGMAQHEALHILVDRLEFTRMASIKHLFADLLGYGPFAMERFSLVTTGALPVAAVQTQPMETPLFLAIINERNFIPGLSGGHASDSLDEFATSFLHSLLYVGHLGTAVHRSELIMADGTRRYLTASNRQTMLREYIRTLSHFREITAGQRRTEFAALQAFFERCLVSATDVQSERLDAALSPQDGWR